TKVRKSLSDGFLYLSGLLLILSLISIAVAWILACKRGWVPEEWGIKNGNHGPWRRFYQARELVWQALSFPVWGFLSAMISMFIKKSRTVIWFMALSLLIWFVIFYTHYWLVD